MIGFSWRKVRKGEKKIKSVVLLKKKKVKDDNFSLRFAR